MSTHSESLPAKANESSFNATDKMESLRREHAAAVTAHRDAEREDDQSYVRRPAPAEGMFHRHPKEINQDIQDQKNVEEARQKLAEIDATKSPHDFPAGDDVDPADYDYENPQQ